MRSVQQFSFLDKREALEDPSFHPAYVAGLVDADGSILLTRHQQYGRLYHSVHAKIAQHRGDDLYDWLCKVFGGKAGIQNSYGVPGWVLTGTKTIPFLKWVRPYLSLKEVEADLAFALLATINPPWDRTRPLTTDIIRLRERLFKQSKAVVASRYGSSMHDEDEETPGRLGAQTGEDMAVDGQSVQLPLF